jgi:hypothetical protein
MSKYQEEHLRNVSLSATYGVVSAPPRRGYIVMAVHEGDSFAVQTYDIVGVVIRNLPRDNGTGSSCAVVPLYINPCYAHEVSGGVFILEHDDMDNFYYSVIWCDWVEREDHVQLESVRAHVAREAQLEIERRKKSS